MRRLAVLVALAVLVLGACGDGDSDTEDRGGGNEQADRVVEVRMTARGFQPASVDVQAGETITFRLVNEDDTLHEFTLGDESKQAERERMMSDMGSMPMEMDDEADSVTVQGGDTEELTWTFREAGTVVYGCHQPGHYAAGEKGTINVS